MRKHQRTRRIIVTGYWILSLIALTGFAAWHFEWISLEGSIPSLTRSKRDNAGDEAKPQPTAHLPDDDIAGDPAVFGEQKEPKTDGDAYQGAAMIGRTSPVPPEKLVPSENWDARTSSEMPENFSKHAEHQAAESRGQVVHAEARTATAESFDAQFDGSRNRQPPRKTLGSEQPEEWNGQGGVRQISNEVEELPGSQPSNDVDIFGQSQQQADPAANMPEIIPIDAKIAEGKLLDAHRELSKLYWNRADLRPLISDRITKTAQSIYFSPQPHYMEPYIVQSNDQMRVIAERYKVPFEYMSKLNRVDPRKIRPGQKLKVIKGPFSAVVDLSDFELTIHAHGYYVKRYQVGTGRDNATPLGKFTVLEKISNPQYTDPDGKVIDADDPTNPLGDRWIDLGDSYGIHGTTEPDSIGKAESRGCVRMRNSDVEEVYDMLSKGSEVLIRQ